MDSQHDELIKLANDCRQIFEETEQGRRIMEHLKKRFHCESTLFVCLDGQPMITVDQATVAANEGQRSVVVYLRDLANMDVDVIRRQKEDHEKEQAAREKRLADIGV